ncbi:uncharacterized protein BKA55DRAFT_667261 [Fusarium redolens]|uniref:WW domain-containing protein n=1 Tax=Fusarium redolens TaxID=48865 RepID=A0A9P9G303_FUSRE|nr:uncharacterized protein BKA55DRAFT_667261 [Fusarium redolens]KAH7232159.1 hypothetical protein BKA55DRAFT_667261 [Fusarium redolens]
MSASISPSPARTGATSSLPPGWIAHWSPDHNAWYYTFTATDTTQWEYPADRTQYSPEGERGIGKTALAIGSGYVLSSSLGNKDDHHHHSSSLGKIAMAGADAINNSIVNQQSSPGSQHYGPPSPGAQHFGPPSPGGQNYGQHPPGGHFAASDTSAVAPMAITPQPLHGPPLYIYGAAFADRDVTQIVRSLVTSQQTLTLTGDTLVQKLGDPWPQVRRKMFSVLYSYGDRTMELLAAVTSMAVIEIKHEAISKERMGFCHGPPSRVIACVWGVENPLTVPLLEQLEKHGEMEGSDATLGDGGFWREPKTLVCYYRTRTVGVGIAFCRQGGTIRLPWNPLAKWS